MGPARYQGCRFVPCPSMDLPSALPTAKMPRGTRELPGPTVQRYTPATAAPNTYRDRLQAPGVRYVIQRAQDGVCTKSLSDYENP